MKIKQLSHAETRNEEKIFPLIVIGENIHSPQNVGMIFRICEIMGVRHLYLTGSSPVPPGRKIAKSARSAEKRVPFSYNEDTMEVLNILKQEKYMTIGLEITDQSKDIRTFDFQSIDKIALIIGAENYGLSASTLNALDVTIQIPMFGTLSSLNVASALSIGLYEIIKQWSN